MTRQRLSNKTPICTKPTEHSGKPFNVTGWRVKKRRHTKKRREKKTRKRPGAQDNRWMRQKESCIKEVFRRREKKEDPGNMAAYTCNSSMRVDTCITMTDAPHSKYCSPKQSAISCRLRDLHIPPHLPTPTPAPHPTCSEAC